MHVGVIHQNSIGHVGLDRLCNSRDEALDTYINKLIGELNRFRLPYEEGKLSEHVALCGVEPVCSILTGSNSEEDLSFFLTAPIAEVREAIEEYMADGDIDDFLEFKAEEFNLGADEYQFGYYEGGLSLVYRTDRGYIQVLDSPVTVRVRPCSPCYPNQGCLDAEGEGSLLTFALPLDWFDEYAPCPYADQLKG